jgi:hypothetical protein
MAATSLSFCLIDYSIVWRCSVSSAGFFIDSSTAPAIPRFVSLKLCDGWLPNWLWTLLDQITEIWWRLPPNSGKVSLGHYSLSPMNSQMTSVDQQVTNTAVNPVACGAIACSLPQTMG